MALLDQLCSFYESDVAKKERLYNGEAESLMNQFGKDGWIVLIDVSVICERLREMNMMNARHDVDELSSIKLQLKTAFNRLIRGSLAEMHRVSAVFLFCIHVKN